MKACWMERATPGVYVEAGPISRGLLGAAARSRVIPSGDAEVGGCRVAFSNLHPTPSLDDMIISWTLSSASIFGPSHQRFLGRRLIWGLGEI